MIKESCPYFFSFFNSLKKTVCRKKITWVFDLHDMFCLLVLEDPVAESSFTYKQTSNI